MRWHYNIWAKKTKSMIKLCRLIFTIAVHRHKSGFPMMQLMSFFPFVVCIVKKISVNLHWRCSSAFCQVCMTLVLIIKLGSRGLQEVSVFMKFFSFDVAICVQCGDYIIPLLTANSVWKSFLNCEWCFGHWSFLRGPSWVSLIFSTAVSS